MSEKQSVGKLVFGQKHVRVFINQ